MEFNRFTVSAGAKELARMPMPPKMQNGSSVFKISPSTSPMSSPEVSPRSSPDSTPRSSPLPWDGPSPMVSPRSSPLPTPAFDHHRQQEELRYNNYQETGILSFECSSPSSDSSSCYSDNGEGGDSNTNDSFFIGMGSGSTSSADEDYTSDCSNSGFDGMLECPQGFDLFPEFAAQDSFELSLQSLPSSPLMFSGSDLDSFSSPESPLTSSTSSLSSCCMTPADGCFGLLEEQLLLGPTEFNDNEELSGLHLLRLQQEEQEQRFLQLELLEEEDKTLRQLLGGYPFSSSSVLATNDIPSATTTTTAVAVESDHNNSSSSSKQEAVLPKTETSSSKSKTKTRKVLRKKARKSTPVPATVPAATASASLPSKPPASTLPPKDDLKTKATSSAQPVTAATSTTTPGSASTPANQTTSSSSTSTNGGARGKRNAPKATRKRKTPEQLAILEREFENNPMPNKDVRDTLSSNLGLSSRQIQIWFQNKRAKVKTTRHQQHQKHQPQSHVQQPQQSQQQQPQQASGSGMVASQTSTCSSPAQPSSLSLSSPTTMATTMSPLATGLALGGLNMVRRTAAAPTLPAFTPQDNQVFFDLLSATGVNFFSLAGLTQLQHAHAVLQQQAHIPQSILTSSSSSPLSSRPSSPTSEIVPQNPSELCRGKHAIAH
ncbi:Short stature homeobox protein 2 [Balamuthia mandrillaris]